MNNYDVVALGELLIDFTENGLSAQGNPVFEANPGGAPCNVLAMLAKLNRKVAFIGKVGADAFGYQLKQALVEVGIDTQALKYDEKVHTTLAIVQTLADGDRDFSFYRKPGADMMLTKDEVPEELIKSAKVFHFGTLSMTDDNNREATKYALDIAKKNGLLISFDPNIRMPLWDSLDELREQMEYGMNYCDILKISDDEITWFTGMENYVDAAKYLVETYDIPFVLVSLGKKGSFAYYKNNIVYADAFVLENTIETTGAGDTFMACMLYGLLSYDLKALEVNTIKEMLQFANAAAALITTKKGALRVMPTLEEINKLQNNGR